MRAMAPSNIPELYEFARQNAYDAARSVICGASGIQRVQLDLVEKVNPLYRGSALQDYYERINRALRSACPVPEPEPIQDLNPGFEGGQCPGVQYGVSGTWTLFNANGSVDITSTFANFTTFGPIEIRPSDTNPAALVLFGFDAQGNPEQQSLGGSGNTSQSIVLTSAQVTRVDGQPDNCGNPPPLPPPPGSPPPTDPRPTFPGVTINLPNIGPVVVAFAPVVGIIYADVDARIKIPVRVNVNIPAINLNYDIDFNIDLNDPSSDPEPIPKPPKRDGDDRPVICDCPIPPDCDEIADEDEEGEEDEDNRRSKGFEVVAAAVLSARNTDPTRATEIGQNSAPSIYAPSIGFINFVYSTNDGSLLYGSDIPVKNVRSVIPAPYTGLRCIRVVGTPNQGFDWEIVSVAGVPKCGC